jgi:hypothetical protein
MKNNNTTLFLIIFILVIAIFINIIISNIYNEGFAVPDELIYLFDNDRICPNCIGFRDTWTSIENEVKTKPFFYKFITNKYNITDDSIGRTLSRDNRINTAPAIIFKSGDSYTIYKGKSADMNSILEWARGG